MTCFHPVNITNPKKIISLDQNEQFLFGVPCGWCQGCLDDKQREYSLRTYYEFLESEYAIFDTLTYCESDVPLLRDFLGSDLQGVENQYCFDYDDIRYFFVRLRRRLSYLGYKQDFFRYFYSTEFGKRKTKRPHIHLMFFVKEKFDPVLFSKLISDCWQHGRTDGVRYRGKKYFLNRCVFDHSKSLEHVFNCVNYVSKYITKELENKSIYHKQIVNFLSPFLKKDQYKLYNSEERKLYRYIWSLRANTHRQSHGFGSYLLECIPESFIRKNCFVYYSHKNLSVKVSVPQYFIRKLYYIRLKYVDGRNFDNVIETWVLNSKGREFKLNRLKNSISCSYKQYKVYLCDKSDLDPKILTYYNFFDYGRLRNYGQSSTLVDIQSKDLLDSLKSKNLLYNYNTLNDYENFGNRGYSHKPIFTYQGDLVSQLKSKKAVVVDSCNPVLSDSVRLACDRQIVGFNQNKIEEGKRRRVSFKRKRKMIQLNKEYEYDY